MGSALGLPARLRANPDVPASILMTEALSVPTPPPIAFIREAECVGCTKCYQACPVDAIVGAARLLHTVLAAECTGCALCLAPCPVDCIELRPRTAPLSTQQQMRAEQRMTQRQARLTRQQGAVECLIAQPIPNKAPDDALKAAKIQLVNRRAALKQAEQRGAEAAELTVLKAALHRAEQALHQAEAHTDRPLPSRLLVDKQPVDPQMRALKTELAFARAALHKLERHPQRTEATLQAARERLNRAEQQLAAYQPDTGKSST